MLYFKSEEYEHKISFPSITVVNFVIAFTAALVVVVNALLTTV